jgi:hypothetical protein
MATKQNLTPVSAAEIRAAYRAGDFTPAEGVSLASLTGKNGDGKVRGRLNPAHVAAFLASPAGKGKSYAEKSVAEARSIDLTLTRRDKNGKSRGKTTVTVPVAEVRVLGGAPAKGRLAQKHIDAAVEALATQRGW